MDKVGRWAFLYMGPEGEGGDFAQCRSCILWDPDKELCAIHGEGLHVPGNATCGLYIYGQPTPGIEIRNIVTPEESAYEVREVRCQNCAHFNSEKSGCELFWKLTNEMPDLFDLDEKVDPNGCCNANTAKGTKGKEGRVMEQDIAYGDIVHHGNMWVPTDRIDTTITAEEIIAGVEEPTK